MALSKAPFANLSAERMQDIRYNNSWTAWLSGPVSLEPGLRCLHPPASTVWRVEDFIIENRKVKGQSQTNWVRWREFDHGDVTSSFVRYQTVLCRLLPVVARGKLRQVPVVISLPEQRGEKMYMISTNLSKTENLPATNRPVRRKGRFKNRLGLDRFILMCISSLWQVLNRNTHNE